MNKNIKTTSSIMFTDIVGYSSMISKDEKHALKLLTTHDKIIEPIIKNANGRINKKIGDAIFAEFNYSIDSVNTAINIQKQLYNRNSISNQEDKINIRIGLHSGEVIRKDDDLFGHDVNLCSRIESVAPKEGIAASSTILSDIKKDKIFSREMGYIKLKNIPEPQQIFKIYIDNKTYENDTSKKLHQSLLDNGINIVDIDTYEIKNTYSIGILYLNNLGLESDESLAYSITESLFSDLEYINEIRTPSFNDVLEFNDTNLGSDDIARKLEVDTILRGNILKKDENINLTFDLLDVNSGKVLWKNKWTEKIVNNKKIRRDIIQSITNQFGLVLPKELENEYSEEITLSGEALELYSKGSYALEILKSNEKLEKGKQHLEEAIDLDSNFVQAYSCHGFICHRLGLFETAEESLQAGLNIAKNKNDDAGKAAIYNVLSIVNNTQGKYKKAREYSEKALEIQIKLNNALKEAKLRTNYANVLNSLNLTDQAIEQNKIAIKIKEDLEEFKSISLSYAVLANTYYAKRDFSQAKEHAIKSLGISRKYGMSNIEGRVLVLLSDILMQCGNYEEMNKYLKDAEIILHSFNDPFLSGKLDFMKVQYFLSENDFDTAFEHLENSIENFKISENKPFIISALVEKVKIFLELNREKEASKLISKVEVQIKKLEHVPLLNVIKIIKSVINYKTINIKDLVSNKELAKDSEQDQIFSNWYLAKAHFLLGKKDKASFHHKVAKDLLDKLSKINSDSNDQKSFLNNIYFHKSIREASLEIKKIPDKIYLNKLSESNTFSFCPQCGYSNKQNFNFCPKCGQDLKPYCPSCERGTISSS